ncbi:hypothetical protein BST37_18620 [Mycobacterium noviomagense]|uniref:MFS transporter n=1 Tax=Mycobacterium noviomagense TaxID=459858 RepID=A0ABX3T0P7_9MYCO|nr:hypothetical protein BST37_18620 [Mycobacterium noviomagense]
MVGQLIGALGRIAVGRWSDRAGSRLRPTRTVAVACFLALLILAVDDYVSSPLAETAMVVAAVSGGLQRVGRQSRSPRDRSGAGARWGHRIFASG